MSEVRTATAERAPAQNVIAELKVSGHLMTLETGLFCIVQVPSRAADPNTGLPGVRVSMPPGIAGKPEVVSISTFRPDGWLYGAGDAALVRVLSGPAQILVTIYQAPNTRDSAPSLQVLRLLEPTRPGAANPPAGQTASASPTPGTSPAVMEMVAHIQTRGDVGALLGDWVGEAGSKRWIEGFAVAPTRLLDPKDIEYQAVLGKGWLSPWVEGGQFCGSRGMALPILGLRLRLRGPAAERFDAFYSASFVDGTLIGPVAAGEACEADSLAPIEAFQVLIRPKAANAPPPEARPAGKARTPTAAKPSAGTRKR